MELLFEAEIKCAARVHGVLLGTHCRPLHPCICFISLSQCVKHSLWTVPHCELSISCWAQIKDAFILKNFPLLRGAETLQSKFTELQALQRTFPASFLSLLTLNERTTNFLLCIIWIQPWQLISLLLVFCQVHERYWTLCPEQQQH